MALLKITSPHATKPGDTGAVMRCVLLATVPGLIALTVFFGIGSIINVLLACGFALGFEAAALWVRKRPIAFYLKDFSAIVTAVLLALALPPYAPWWLVAVGVFFSIIVAKHLYGGLGFNPFNPAMVGYVVLLISFPLEMTMWAAPISSLGTEASLPSLGDALGKVFLGIDFVTGSLDGYTAATPLDIVRQNESLLLEDLYQTSAAFNGAKWAGAGWEWVNLMFLAGGAYLLYKRVFTWHAPVSMLVSLGLLAAIFYDGGSSSSQGSPLFHWLTGATMLGAFFIVTDPVTSAVSNRGRIIYGALVGLIIFVIRSWGNYPDGMAFAVLLMNFAAPFIDYYTQPRTYGHKKPTVATKKAE